MESGRLKSRLEHVLFTGLAQVPVGVEPTFEIKRTTYSSRWTPSKRNDQRILMLVVASLVTIITVVLILLLNNNTTSNETTSNETVINSLLGCEVPQVSRVDNCKKAFVQTSCLAFPACLSPRSNGFVGDMNEGYGANWDTTFSAFWFQPEGDIRSWPPRANNNGSFDGCPNTRELIQADSKAQCKANLYFEVGTSEGIVTDLLNYNNRSIMDAINSKVYSDIESHMWPDNDIQAHSSWANCTYVFEDGLFARALDAYPLMRTMLGRLPVTYNGSRLEDRMVCNIGLFGVMDEKRPLNILAAEERHLQGTNGNINVLYDTFFCFMKKMQTGWGIPLGAGMNINPVHVFMYIQLYNRYVRRSLEPIDLQMAYQAQNMSSYSGLNESDCVWLGNENAVVAARYL